MPGITRHVMRQEIVNSTSGRLIESASLPIARLRRVALRQVA